MLRLDFEEADPVAGPFAERLRGYVEMKLREHLDAVIISDYGKGACTEETCQQIICSCHAYGVPVITDPKARAGKSTHRPITSPNLKELNTILPEPIKNKDGAVETAARYAMQRFQLQNMLATRSENGLSLVTDNEVTHIPTRAQEVFDVSGAGDTGHCGLCHGAGWRVKARGKCLSGQSCGSVCRSETWSLCCQREELLAALK